VLERARQNELVDTRSANLPCEVLDDLLRVDRSASASADATIKDLKRSLAKLRPPNDPDEQLQQSRARASIEEVERMKARIDKQVASMVSQEEAQGCVDSFATYDRSAVLERAKRQTLSPERAIQRAKSDQLVTLRGAEVGCKSLTTLREVDRTAIRQLQPMIARARSLADVEERDSLLVVERNLRRQLTKLDRELAAYCNVDDFSAGAMGE